MLEKESYGKTYLVPELEDVLGATDLGVDHTVDDWPWGRKQRCSMHFFVETHPKRGQRFVKQSTFKGRVNKPKTSTYASRVKIIELDGKIGHIEFNEQYSMCAVLIEDGKYLGITFHDDESDTLAEHFFKD